MATARSICASSARRAAGCYASCRRKWLGLLFVSTASAMPGIAHWKLSATRRRAGALAESYGVACRPVVNGMYASAFNLYDGAAISGRRSFNVAQRPETSAKRQRRSAASAAPRRETAHLMAAHQWLDVAASCAVINPIARVSRS